MARIEVALLISGNFSPIEFMYFCAVWPCVFLTPEIRPNQQHFVNISSDLDELFKLKFQKIKNKIIGIDMIDRINEIFAKYFVENILLCFLFGKLSIEL